jgi:hypothetical protein
MTTPLSTLRPCHVIYAISDIFNALQGEIARVEEKLERPQQLGLAATALTLELAELRTVSETVQVWRDQGKDWARTETVLADPFPLHRSPAHDGLIKQIQNGRLHP